MEHPSNTRIGWKVVHLTGPNVHQFQSQRSKVKITRPTNAHTVNVQCLPNGKTYEVQGWYTVGAGRPASAVSAVTSKVKGQSRKVTWRVWQVLPISRERNVLETPKLVGRLSTPRAIMRTSFKVIGQRSRSPDRYNVEVRYIFRTERPTNF